MPCYRPLTAWRDGLGTVSFVDRGQGDQLLLPCGRCIGCRLERSRQWATRIMFEAQMHEASSFITLTYDDANLPFPPSLRYRDFQLFMKRLRIKYGAVRFYMCGEYGESTFRPHFHACLFGLDFSDKVIWSVSPRGDHLYRSPNLERIWPFGISTIGELTFESAAYVARYVLKKITGDLAEEHYSWTDVDTGEVYAREPEFAHMSLRPGIGASWFDKYSDDVYDDHDFVVVNGKTCKPPRYFDKLLRRLDVSRGTHEYDLIKSERSCGPTSVHASESRLVAREMVARAALSKFYERSL